MAVLHARGMLKVGDSFVGRSIINSEFICRIEGEVTVGGRPGIIPSISGRAWITGTHQHMLDPDDPWPSWLPAVGYLAADVDRRDPNIDETIGHEWTWRRNE